MWGWYIKRQPAVVRCIIIVNSYEIALRKRSFKIQLYPNHAAFYTTLSGKGDCVLKRVNYPSVNLQSLSASFPTPNNDFFSAACEKKQCKYCHLYSLCKLPEVMQAKFQFLSHHCSLNLAIHAQTFGNMLLILH